jgi:glutathione S-transferase
MYAPVVTRLKTYAVQMDSDTDAYCKAVLAYPPMKEWVDAAKNEPWLIESYEMK